MQDTLYTFADGAAEGAGGSMFSMLVMFAAMFVIIYFVMIRPQQKQQKRHQELIGSLKKGDEVVLSSGITGRVFSVDDKFVLLEIADKVRLKVLKQAIQSFMSTASTDAPVANEKTKVE